MKLLLDMNLSPRWVKELARFGVQAQHWSQVGAMNAPDAELLKYAQENACVIVTHDLDFSAMLAVGQLSKPSVIQLRDDDLTPELACSQVAQVVQSLAAELAQGSLVLLSRDRVRIRHLPMA
jgi:predicted nuclease of predicted toxin-antitoxin system